MGLLSDPSLTPRNKLGRGLVKHSDKICLLFYVASLAWFICLAHPDFNHGTYLSENALSPGLVYAEMKQDSSRLAHTLLDELRRERAGEHKSTTPHAWIEAKMQQIGLETHVQHFTLRYPFAGGKEFHGKNVYGILRAPRIGSTEGVVFTAPYRAASSVHTDIAASVPVLLAFADFARKKNYWAKDLIFLVTEQEQLGMHAWLEAYYEGGTNDSVILNSGDLPARAGALQAALNLEIQDLDIDFIDVKIEGLNGQLPNLDMFNLVQRITSREGISAGYKQTPRKKRRRAQYIGIEDNLRHMLAMLASQASGVPNGNHGLFHRYRIEALTLEAVRRTTHSNQNKHNLQHTAALPLLKTIEGISRSLNNLLERFHQSYFFYILVQNDRFVSIGDFMPCLILLVAPLFMKSFLLWLCVDDDDEQQQLKDEAEKTAKTVQHDPTAAEVPTKRLRRQLPYDAVLLFCCIALGLGAFCNTAAVHLCVSNMIAWAPRWSAADAVALVLLGISALGALMTCTSMFVEKSFMELLQIVALNLLGVALIVVGLLNFALGFGVAVFSVPLAILVSAKRSTQFGGALRRTLARIYAVCINPLLAVYVLVAVLTLFQFPELSWQQLLVRAYAATKDAVTFALVDRMIYGNWLFTVMTTVFFPLWIFFMCLAFGTQPPIGAHFRWLTDGKKLKEKTN